MSISTEGVGVPRWDLADRLAKSLRLADMSQQQMADHLEVHRNTVGNWLNDKGKPPSRPILIAWAFRTGVPFEWIKDGIDPSEPGPNGPDGGNKEDGGQPLDKPTDLRSRRRLPAPVVPLGATG